MIFSSRLQMEKKESEGYQLLRTSTLILDSPEQGEECEDLRGESDGSPPSQDYCRVTVKHETISGQFQETTFTVITLNQESNFTCREKSHSQFQYEIFLFGESPVKCYLEYSSDMYCSWGEFGKEILWLL